MLCLIDFEVKLIEVAKNHNYNYKQQEIYA